jgi:diadenosine tetraphosphate (Ap4A) HIT family hydrolase
MPSLFTRIIDGELPGHFVWKDSACVAFLTIEPVHPGHTLVVPVEEIDHWLDLPADLVTHLMTVAQLIGKAQHASFGTQRIGLVIAGLEVPHTHLHVIPMDSMRDLDFHHARQTSSTELEMAASAIRGALHEMGYAEQAGEVSSEEAM